MPLPKALITLATLGTDNQSIERSTLAAALRYLPNPRNVETLSRQMLTTAAGMKLRDKAGWKPPITPDPLPEQSDKAEEELCSRAAIRILLGLQYKPREMDHLLKEWFAEVGLSGKGVPGEWLPMILRLGQEKRPIRESIIGVVGKRGEWFCEQVTHTNWIWFKPRDIDHYWRSGTVQERFDLIEVLRKMQPAQARNMVTARWEREDDETRKRFIKAFRIGLHRDDEVFLEIALMDSAREVRLVARKLLVRLPDSALRQHMERRAATVLQMTTMTTANGQAKISLQPYPQSNNGKAELSVDPYFWEDAAKTYTASAVDRAAVYVSFVPIRFWLARWNLSYQEFYAAVSNNPPIAPLMWTALRDSVARFEDTEGADALFPFASPHLKQEQRRSLFDVMSQERIEAETIALLNNTREGIHFTHPAVHPLFSLNAVWSQPLTEALLNSIRRYLQGAETVPEHLTQSIYEHFATCIPLLAAEHYLDIIEGAAFTDEEFVMRRNNIRQVIEQRVEMHAAIHGTK